MKREVVVRCISTDCGWVETGVLDVKGEARYERVRSELVTKLVRHHVDTRPVGRLFGHSGFEVTVGEDYIGSLTYRGGVVLFDSARAAGDEG